MSVVMALTEEGEQKEGGFSSYPPLPLLLLVSAAFSLTSIATTGFLLPAMVQHLQHFP